MDTLVLGCTHYPLLEPAVRRVVGPAVTLVDSAAAVSARVAEDLAASGVESTTSVVGGLELLVTDDSPAFSRLAERILGESVRLHWVDTVPATAALIESLP
jgi:glutamate racemase